MDYITSNKQIDALHGGDVYRNEVRLDFSVNLNPSPMPVRVEEALKKGIAEIRQYPDPLQQKLRASIAAFEGADPEDIICGNGASELLMAAVHAVMPRKALVTAPCYAGYAAALKASDAEIREYPLKEEMEFSLDREFLDHISDDIDMVFIADPNNPNGKLIDPGLKREIAEKCEKCGAVLVIDECFYPLTEAGAEGTCSYGSALHLRAFTKTFAIPGVRLGYMISSDAEMLRSIRKHLPEWNVSRIAERAGEAAAEVLCTTDHLITSARLIRREREYLSEQLRRLGIKVYGSDTNYLLIRSRADLYGMLLEKGILIRRCANFSGLDGTYFRIAVRAHEDNEELIRTLEELL